MGARQDYECVSCDARAVVSGGPDVGMECQTITVGCCECGKLDDVVIATFRDGASFYEDPGVMDDGDDLPTGRACGADAVVRWTGGDPCPRCGGPSAGTGHVIEVWD